MRRICTYHKAVAFAYVASFAILILFSIPSIASAADCGATPVAGRGTFVPLECYVNSKKLSSLYADTKSLSTYLNTIFKVAIAAGAMLAVLRLTYAGYLYMGGDMWGNKQKAKDIIRDVFIGIFLLLSIYVILKQINPNLLNLGVTLDKIQPTDAGAPPTLPPGTPPTPQDRNLAAILADESRVRGLFDLARVRVNRDPCKFYGQDKCTTVGLLPDRAIGGVMNLRVKCGCTVIVTGGTEWWQHDTHGPGMPAVDLNKDRGGALDRYIVRNAQKKYTTNSFTKDRRTIEVYELDGAKYYSEDESHWHVVY